MVYGCVAAQVRSGQACRRDISRHYTSVHGYYLITGPSPRRRAYKQHGRPQPTNGSKPLIHTRLLVCHRTHLDASESSEKRLADRDPGFEPQGICIAERFTLAQRLSRGCS